MYLSDPPAQQHIPKPHPPQQWGTLTSGCVILRIFISSSMNWDWKWTKLRRRRTLRALLHLSWIMLASVWVRTCSAYPSSEITQSSSRKRELQQTQECTNLVGRHQSEIQFNSINPSSSSVLRCLFNQEVCFKPSFCSRIPLCPTSTSHNTHTSSTSKMLPDLVQGCTTIHGDDACSLEGGFGHPGSHPNHFTTMTCGNGSTRNDSPVPAKSGHAHTHPIPIPTQQQYSPQQPQFVCSKGNKESLSFIRT